MIDKNKYFNVLSSAFCFGKHTVLSLDDWLVGEWEVSKDVRAWLVLSGGGGGGGQRRESVLCVCVVVVLLLLGATGKYLQSKSKFLYIDR